MANKTIKAGGDYTTVSGWSAYVNALTLLADEFGLVTGEITDTGNVTLGGWVATIFSVTLTADSGQSFRDNANVRSNALRYDSANGAALKNTGGNYNVTGDSFKLQNLQTNQSSNGYVDFVWEFGGASWAADNNIIRGDGRLSSSVVHVASGGDGGSITNLALVNNGSSAVTAGILFQNGSVACSITDAILFGSSGKGTGISCQYGTPAVVKNVVVRGFTNDYGSTANAASTNNATDKGSFGGTNYGTSGQVSVPDAAFISVTPGSEDLRLSATPSPLGGNGVTAGPATDISNTAWDSPHSIGCWALSGGGGGTTVGIRFAEHLSGTGVGNIFPGNRLN